MAQSSHKYYFSIEDRLIDFERLSDFPDMTSFIMLILFAGIFEDREALLNGLKSLGLIEKQITIDSSIVIVKGSKKKQDAELDLVTDKLLYKADMPLLSIKSIDSFFLDNRHNYAIIKEFLSGYLEEVEDLIKTIRGKVNKLQTSLSLPRTREHKKLKEQLDKKNNSLNNFLNASKNIQGLLRLIDESANKPLSLEREHEYVDRLMNFINREVSYVAKGKYTTNYRRLVKLVLCVKDYLEKYPELARPENANSFVNKRVFILQAYKKALASKKIENRDRRPTKYADLPSGDPDNFMFLEEEDFSYLLQSEKEDTVTSAQVDLENLATKKGTFGK